MMPEPATASAAPSPVASFITPEDAVLKLRRLHLFDQLNAAEFNDVAHLLKTKTLAAGEVLYTQGEKNWTLYLVRQGRLQARRKNADDQEKIIGAAEAGRVFNVLPFVSRSHALETVQAETPSRVWMIEPRDFEELAQRNPGIMGRLQITDDDARKILSGDPMFARLTSEEIAQVIGVIEEVKIDLHTLVYKQGDYEGGLFIVREGAVIGHRADKVGREHLLGVVGPGSVLNRRAFAVGIQSEETIEAGTPITVWKITKEAFDALQSAEHPLREKLALDAEAEAVHQLKKKFDWQQPDELILFAGRRHWWSFARHLLPFFAALLVDAVLGVLSLQERFSNFELPLLAAAIIVFLLAMAYMVWHFWDWRNDDFVVTDKRVVHRERTVLLRDEQNQVPVSQVQDVTVTRANFIHLLFDIGDVKIDAQGAKSRVVFDGVPHPDAVKEAIFHARERSFALAYAVRRAEARVELRTQLGWDAAPPPSILPKDYSDAGQNGRELVKKNWDKRFKAINKGAKKVRSTLLPYQRLEENNQIIYRTHWLELLKNIAAPVMGILLVAVMFVISLTQQNPFLLALSGLAGLIALGIFIWQYEDWRNDIYILGEDRIIDIIRSPFGLRGTKRKEASYSVVQNVDASTSGFIDSLFNIGKVVVRTAGADNELVFARVWDPRKLQHDIETRVAEFKAKQTEKENIKRRTEMADMLSLYDEMRRTQKL